MGVVINSDDPSYQVYMDVPTAHEISKIVPERQHNVKCSFRSGFVCDCAIMKAADRAVEAAKERVSEWYAAHTKLPQSGKEKK